MFRLDTLKTCEALLDHLMSNSLPAEKALSALVALHPYCPAGSSGRGLGKLLYIIRRIREFSLSRLQPTLPRALRLLVAALTSSPLELPPASRESETR